MFTFMHNIDQRGTEFHNASEGDGERGYISGNHKQIGAKSKKRSRFKKHRCLRRNHEAEWCLEKKGLTVDNEEEEKGNERNLWVCVGLGMQRKEPEVSRITRKRTESDFRYVVQLWTFRLAIIMFYSILSLRR
ncbi:hypothetical protein VNO77_24084 [Canavalia gladiata]|uniref:Uncharacterized protein n=1 Tax=Canavalia gladiata TaxID=3824 RepID=A0AAN9L839_CANGL